MILKLKNKKNKDFVMELTTKHTCLACNFYTIVCAETFKCLACCTAQNHGHCLSGDCGSINLCDANCAFHCTNLNHGHCAIGYCSKTQNICKDNSFCVQHCGFIDHMYCTEFNCKNKEGVSKNKKGEYIFHCHFNNLQQPSKH